ncbi:hypothetical protein H6F77_12610 [Microcoleus sp. FACHB-831]|uniref:hypothetical protein n=1 Tax=Microcoleus sp. FACHB-831 TaxID=2692827 RepID=UPI0016897F77|nr:hypothetical protein [Microcoleus sp. FACHB-831]MBD1921928.1 hypothetical protein [Microcoleus sp. FACHB-831]
MNFNDIARFKPKGVSRFPLTPQLPLALRGGGARGESPQCGRDEGAIALLGVRLARESAGKSRICKSPAD